MPVIIKIGPKILTIWTCRKFDIARTARRPDTMVKAIAMYVMTCPSVYKRLDSKTIFLCSAFLPIKEIATILVASGQGLIDVKMPSHKEVVSARIISFI